MIANALSSALILGLLLAGGPATVGDGGGEKEKAHAEALALAESGDWAGALRAFRRYRKEFGLTEDESREVKGWMRRAEGEIALREIEEEYLETSNARRAVEQLERFLKEYGEIEALRVKGRDLRSRAEEVFRPLILSFEGDRWPRRSSGSPPLKETDPDRVRDGKRAARWRLPGESRSSRFWVRPRIENWSSYTLMRVWVFSETRPERPGSITIEIGSEDLRRRAKHRIPVDFKGWKEIVIPLRGPKGQFGDVARVDWQKVTVIEFVYHRACKVPLDIVLDDIRLER